MYVQANYTWNHKNKKPNPNYSTILPCLELTSGWSSMIVINCQLEKCHPDSHRFFGLEFQLGEKYSLHHDEN